MFYPFQIRLGTYCGRWWASSMFQRPGENVDRTLMSSHEGLQVSLHHYRHHSLISTISRSKTFTKIALPFVFAAEQCSAKEAGEAFIWKVEECCWGSPLKHIMKTRIRYHCGKRTTRKEKWVPRILAATGLTNMSHTNEKHSRERNESWHHCCWAQHPAMMTTRLTLQHLYESTFLLTSKVSLWTVVSQCQYSWSARYCRYIYCSSWHLTFHPTVLRTAMLSVCYLGMQSKLETREQYFSYCSP